MLIFGDMSNVHPTDGDAEDAIAAILDKARRMSRAAPSAPARTHVDKLLSGDVGADAFEQSLSASVASVVAKALAMRTAQTAPADQRIAPPPIAKPEKPAEPSLERRPVAGSGLTPEPVAVRPDPKPSTNQVELSDEPAYDEPVVSQVKRTGPSDDLDSLLKRVERADAPMTRDPPTAHIGKIDALAGRHASAKRVENIDAPVLDGISVASQLAPPPGSPPHAKTVKPDATPAPRREMRAAMAASVLVLLAAAAYELRSPGGAGRPRDEAQASAARGSDTTTPAPNVLAPHDDKAAVDLTANLAAAPGAVPPAATLGGLITPPAVPSPKTADVAAVAPKVADAAAPATQITDAAAPAAQLANAPAPATQLTSAAAPKVADASPTSTVPARAVPDVQRTDERHAAVLLQALTQPAGAAGVPVAPVLETASGWQGQLAALKNANGITVVRYDALRAARPNADLEIVAPLAAEPVYFVTRADSALTWVHELRGRVIDAGPKQGSRALTSHSLYRALFDTEMPREPVGGLDEGAGLRRLLVNPAIDAVAVVGVSLPEAFRALPAGDAAKLKILQVDATHTATRRATRDFLLMRGKSAPIGRNGQSVTASALGLMSFLVTARASPRTAAVHDSAMTAVAQALCGRLPELQRSDAWRGMQPGLEIDVAWPYSAAAHAVLSRCSEATAAPSRAPAGTRTSSS